MPNASIVGVRLCGLSAAVPEKESGTDDLIEHFGAEVSAKLVASSGVLKRRLARPGQTTGDLCEFAAKTLLERLNWDPKSVDVLIVVSQTFDHIAPATSCILHGRLGLAKSAAAFDVGLGCSGWVYGVWLASSLLKTGCKRALVLAGDTCSQLISPHDNFGALASDAGTATALEAGDSGVLHFSLGSDGMGWKALWVPAGGFRQRSSTKTREYHDCDDGARRNYEQTHMNGPDIFTFTIREVPPLVDRVLALAGWNKSQVDAFVFHQANKYMLNHLAKRMDLSADRIPLSIQDFGNTSSASIPLTMQQQLREKLTGGSMKLLMCGFGVGLSWGAVAADVGPLVVPELQYLP
jgi:3-oxoacyl-[acyl-carrier-protein] synthase-3